MTIKQALATLVNYNKWRLGGDMPQPAPKDITAAIDAACAYLNQYKNLQKNLDNLIKANGKKQAQNK